MRQHNCIAKPTAPHCMKAAYLVTYNAVSCVGWTYILWSLCSILLTEGGDLVLSAVKLWTQIETPLTVLQSFAFMEVLHALTGLVRSPVGSSLMQVSSRLFVVWVVLDLCPGSRYHWGFLLTIASWSLVEVPRYAFYAMTVVGTVPDWLFFLRYHLYMVLYITGLVGEVSCMIHALPFLSSGVYSIQLPNTHNIAISLYVIVCIMIATYALCCPIMYKHMTTQRINAYAKKEKDRTS